MKLSSSLLVYAFIDSLAAESTTKPTFPVWSGTGCPSEWIEGTEYKSKDLAAVDGVVYECSGQDLLFVDLFCGLSSYKPGNSLYWEVAWKRIGSCTGTISPTTSPVYVDLADVGGCPDDYKSDDRYESGDTVSFSSRPDSDRKVVYQCKDWPYSAYCNAGNVYSPGSTHASLGWEVKGWCDGTNAPTSSPIQFSGACEEDEPWSLNHISFYKEGHRVRKAAKIYECRPWPYSLRCSDSLYEPEKTQHWQEAWSYVGKCVTSSLPVPESTPSFDTSECITPTGLQKLEQSGAYAGIREALLSPELPYLFLPLAQPFIEQFVKAETPIQFRLAQIHGSTVYHTAAKYHATALDIWGNDVNRYCTQGTDPTYLKIHEEVATMLTFYYSGITLVPSTKTHMDPILNQFGLDASLFELGDGPETPWGMAKFVVDEMAVTVVNDGWNANGKLANEFNALPYSDFSITGANGVAYDKYEVNPDIQDTEDFMHWPWQPLLESDGLGYFTKQEHVTPFAGFTTRLYGMDRQFYNSVMAPPPEYRYNEEAINVLENTRMMATNETQKMLLEYFDSKFTSLLPIQIGWSIASGESNFNFWFNDMVMVNAIYDALLVVWKEKVVYDLARPTTVVHKILQDQMVDSYAGPYLGSQVMKAQDWQPFIRVMPHSEYPSGSACVCTAYSDAMALLTGSDNIAVPVTHTFPAGSSKAEPGVTPSNDLTIQFTKWSEIAKQCGESRLYGGMHFEKSVTAANNMCSGFVNQVVDKATLLKMGDSSGALTSKEEDIEVTPKRNGHNFDINNQ